MQLLKASAGNGPANLLTCTRCFYPMDSTCICNQIESSWFGQFSSNEQVEVRVWKLKFWKKQSEKFWLKMQPNDHWKKVNQIFETQNSLDPKQSSWINEPFEMLKIALQWVFIPVSRWFRFQWVFAFFNIFEKRILIFYNRLKIVENFDSKPSKLEIIKIFEF